MRFGIPALVFVALCLGASQAGAASSCSSFVVIKSYDEAAKTVEVSYEKGKQRAFFPKPEGSPRDTSKIPKECRSKVKKTKSFVVKPTGGRMSVTQVRSKVVAVIRPGVGKDAPLGITTLYLPITEEELAEIKRIEDEAEDV
jgi:hypothetical protein